jgi:hypothetical protein
VAPGSAEGAAGVRAANGSGVFADVAGLAAMKRYQLEVYEPVRDQVVSALEEQRRRLQNELQVVTGTLSQLAALDPVRDEPAKRDVVEIAADQFEQHRERVRLLLKLQEDPSVHKPCEGPDSCDYCDAVVTLGSFARKNRGASG